LKKCGHQPAFFSAGIILLRLAIKTKVPFSIRAALARLNMKEAARRAREYCNWPGRDIDVLFVAATPCG
jgi:hypothetical protein